MEKLLGRMLVPPTLNENIEHSTMLVDRPPQACRLAIDGEEDYRDATYPQVVDVAVGVHSHTVDQT